MGAADGAVAGRRGTVGLWTAAATRLQGYFRLCWRVSVWFDWFAGKKRGRGVKRCCEMQSFVMMTFLLLLLSPVFFFFFSGLCVCLTCPPPLVNSTRVVWVAAEEAALCAQTAPGDQPVQDQAADRVWDRARPVQADPGHGGRAEHSDLLPQVERGWLAG